MILIESNFVFKCQIKNKIGVSEIIKNAAQRFHCVHVHYVRAFLNIIIVEEGYQF